MITHTHRWTYLAANLAAIALFCLLCGSSELYATGSALKVMVGLHLPMLLFVLQTVAYFGGWESVRQADAMVVLAVVVNLLFPVWVILIPFLHSRIRNAAIHLGIAAAVSMAIHILNTILVTLRHV